MRITVVLGAFFPVPPILGGAVEKVWFELAQEFARRGHKVVLISRAMPGLPREETSNGVQHRRVAGFNAPRSVLWLKFLDLLYSMRAVSSLPESDIVVTNTFWLPILIPRAYVHVARYPKGQMRFYGRAVRLQVPSAAVAQGVSNEAPNLSDRLKVIPYPAPKPNTASPPPSLADREKIILYVGRVHPEKGVHLLVKAFASCARTIFADWKLMITGPVETKFGGGGEAYLESLKSMAENTSTTFSGPVFDSTELEQKYRAARVFVYPSLAETGESFGLAPLEAMTHGCAVLVSDLACFRDFIRDGETGFVFDHRSAEPERALVNALEKVIVDPALMSRTAEAGLRKSLEYSVENVAGQFIADFESLASQIHA